MHWSTRSKSNKSTSKLAYSLAGINNANSSSKSNSSNILQNTSNEQRRSNSSMSSHSPGVMPLRMRSRIRDVSKSTGILWDISLVLQTNGTSTWHTLSHFHLLLAQSLKSVKWGLKWKTSLQLKRSWDCKSLLTLNL